VTARRRVVVIGGGIAGVSAAWALAEHHDVVLLEAEPELGAHATGRSAATLSETSGSRAVCALARVSRSFLENPPPDFTEVPLTGPRGLLWIGRREDEPALDALAEVAASGVAPTAERVDAVRAREILPALRAEAVTGGGMWEPDARSLDVAALLAAYARGARARGAEFYRATPALTLVPRAPTGWTVETPAGSRPADVVVDAAGAWGDVVAARAGVATLDLRVLRRTACLVPAPPDVASWPLVMDAGGRCYFEPESGGLLVSPADEHPTEPVDAQPEMEDVAWGLEMLHETTTLSVRSVRRAWAGLRTFAADRVPVVGWAGDQPTFCWLVGQGGAGVKTAPAMAAAVAAIVGERDWPAELTSLGVTAASLAPDRPGLMGSDDRVDDQHDRGDSAQRQEGGAGPAVVEVAPELAAGDDAEQQSG
jgi:D-arginine dehydrogenase